MRFFITAPFLFISAMGAVIRPEVMRRASGLSTVYQFPNNTWIENLAVRSNGRILATRLFVPILYQIDPSSANPTPEIIYTFPNQNSLLGITEISPDVFAVIQGQSNLTIQYPIPGTFSVWTVNMNTAKPTITQVAKIPSAKFLNGMTTLSKNPPQVLISDSVLGAIYRLNIATGAYSIVLSDANTMTAPAGSPVVVGINGVRYDGAGTVFYANLVRGLYCSVAINSDGTARGPYKTITSSVPGADDFALGSSGSAYVAAHGSNTLFKVTSGGTVSVVAGGSGSSQLLDPTSAQFGRTSSDRNTLYITTAGDPSVGAGGKIAKIQVSEGCLQSEADLVAN